MIGKKNIEVSKVKEVGKIQVAVCGPSHIHRSSTNNASPLRAIFHSLKGSLSRPFERFLGTGSSEEDFTDELCKFIGQKSLAQALSSEKRKGLATIIINNMSQYKSYHCRHHFRGFQQYHEPLLLVEYAFEKNLIAMLSWNTHPEDHFLEKIEVNGRGIDLAKFHRGDLEDYVGLHFAFLKLNNYFVEQEIDGLKFYAIRLNRDSELNLSEHSNKHHERKQSLDTTLFVNYCPYLPYSEPSSVARISGRAVLAEVEEQLSERDLLAIQKSILDDVLKNGLDVSKKKYSHSYAIEILEGFKDMDRTSLIQLKYELSKKTIALSHLPSNV